MTTQNYYSNSQKLVCFETFIHIKSFKDMAAKPIKMSKIKQIVKLKKLGISLSEISRSLDISRNTVKKYLRLIEVKNISFEELLQKDDHTIELLFQEPKKKSIDRYENLEKMFPYLEKELKRTGVTRWLLWGEYRAKYPDGYSYSQFCEHFFTRLKNNQAVMHFEHSPADKMFIDFTGKKLYVTDRKTGEIRAVEVYVSILGYSQMTYVEAVASQKKEDFISASQNALHFFGGVPKVLIPDNLKSAVTKANKYEADLNESFSDFANHYQTAVLPARSLKPRDKSLVEKHVSIVYNRIYAPMRNQVFFSLEELNSAIFDLLEKHNNMNFQQEKISRKEKFEQFEKPKLQPLVSEGFEIKYYKNATVMKNYHIQLRQDKHYYSAPYRYIGKKVRIIYTASSVSIFYKHERIAFHRRNLRNFVYTTVKEHMPSTHQFVSDWNPDKFISWAAGISPVVEKYIRKIIEKKVYPEQAYRSCVGILSFDKKAGSQRLINAIKRADSYGVYKTIKNIIDGKLDTLPEQEESETKKKLPTHNNIRGAGNYK